MSGAITITQKIKYSLGFATPLNKQVTLMRVFFPETGEEDSTKCQAISTFVRRHISRDLNIPISSFSTFHCKKSCEGNSEASFVVQIFFRSPCWMMTQLMIWFHFLPKCSLAINCRVLHEEQSLWLFFVFYFIYNLSYICYKIINVLFCISFS